MKKMHIVPHSHWDREWYMSFSKHRYKLIQLIDEVIEELEKGNFPYFQMDGQFIPIEDYLEIRPHNRERIKALVQSGKLLIGPWYVLQDEYLIGGEANVRNLAYGIEESKKFGRVSMVGHMPDAFGNISQMPQILQGFGIDNAIFGRGITPILWGCDDIPTYPESASELKWTSPDGTSVIGVQMSCWYDNARELPTEKDALSTKLHKLTKVMSKIQATPYYLGMNGCDHQPLQKDLPEAVQLANELGYPLEISNLERYVNDVRPYASSFLEVVGELNSQKTSGYKILVNTASTRIYMKQLNYKAEYMLNGLLEPLYSLNYMAGGEYDQDVLDYSWKTLLKNYPHDSICCCSIDQVIKDMEGRFHAVIDTCEMAIEDISPRLVSQESIFNDCKNVVVYNLSPFATSEWVETELMFNVDNADSPFHLIDEEGKNIPFEEISREMKKVYELPRDSFRIIHEKCIVKVRILVSVDGFGYKILHICEGEQPKQSAIILFEDKQIETENIILTINSNGSFNLFDKRSKKLYERQNIYEYIGDIGDEYNTELAGEPITTEKTVANITVDVTDYTAIIKICNEMQIPKYYNSNLKAFEKQETLTIETTLMVNYNSPMVKINTKFVNKCENYRLRALFNYNCQKDYCTADIPFDMARRNLIREKEWENPNNDDRMNAFVEYADQFGGILISGKGIHEYEVKGTEKIAGITLLRAVGKMGDWFDFSTPEAQCKGESDISYAFIPLLDEYDEQGVLEGYSFYKPCLYAQGCANVKNGLSDLTFFRFKRNGIVQCSAVKRANDGNGIIVRLYNPTSKDVNVKFDSFKETRIFACNLDESVITEIYNQKLMIPAKKIMSFKIKRKSNFGTSCLGL